MFATLFRFGTYYVIWKSFQRQFVALLMSTVLAAMILGLYDDLYGAFKIADKGLILYLIISKWALLFLIVAVNILLFKRYARLSKNDYNKENPMTREPKDESYESDAEKNIKAKKFIKSKSDLILDRYKK